MKDKEIFDRVSIVNVKNKLQLHEIYSIGDVIYVRCPFCESKKGAMKLITSNNSYICKNCGERGYAVGLYAKCNFLTNKEAYKKLIKEEANIQNGLQSSLIINTKKNDEELDSVYQAFLQLLTLNPEHIMLLLKLGFTIEDIERIGFKTIPTDENTKLNICNKLIDDGFDLEKIPGFYQDKKFRWNFNSHKGIFIPIISNCRIVSLRIHLDSMYNTDTTDIWFSSANKYNGTKTNNSIMTLLPEQNRLQLINDTKRVNNIIIASEMLLAYRIQSEYRDKIVIRNSKCYYKN